MGGDGEGEGEEGEEIERGRDYKRGRERGRVGRGVYEEGRERDSGR